MLPWAAFLASGVGAGASGVFAGAGACSGTSFGGELPNAGNSSSLNTGGGGPP